MESGEWKLMSVGFDFGKVGVKSLIGNWKRRVTSPVGAIDIITWGFNPRD
jgi:hypothetical protein